MPIYEYEHLGKSCKLGKIFDIKQSINDERLVECPYCHGTVRKLISQINFCVPKSNNDIRQLGFTKLVKRDDGIYENVTRRGNESRYMERGKPETVPNLSKIIKD
jgi:putative FmdB family regulatory protein